MSFLTIRNLHISYGNTTVLHNFNLSVEEGSIYSIVGPSGCGKSTLLKAICGIIHPSKGDILLKNEAINPRKQSFGYIPQHYGLLDWLSIRENLSLGRKIRKMANALPDDDIIQQLNIQDLLDRYPKELSGGQQQRVALARAWMLQPELLLMDEPFSSLDTCTAEKSRELFVHFWKEHKTTTLFVTHNIQEAIRLGKYIVLLSSQPAKVLEIIENPLFKSGVSRNNADFYQVELLVNRRIQEIWEDDK